MGLKGKVEAIIYAAEEPITLEQISLLMKDAVLQELSAEQARAAELAVEQAAERETEAAEVVETSTPAEQTEAAAEETEAADSELHPVTAQQECGTQSVDEAAEVGTPVVDEPAADALAATGPAAEAEAAENAPLPVAPKRRSKPEIPPEVKSRVRTLIEELIRDCADADRGMEIRQIANGYRMATKPEHHDIVKAFVKSLKPPLRLSMPALETLAVIAYKQPVTAPEVGEIRSVDSQGVFATLLDRKLITTAGRKQVIGRPILYKTTKEFLLRFGLKDLSELPSMEEFEKLAQDANTVEMFEGPERSSPTGAVEQTPPWDEGVESMEDPETLDLSVPPENAAPSAEIADRDAPEAVQTQGEVQASERAQTAPEDAGQDHSEEPVH